MNNAKRRLELIAELGFTITPEMVAKEEKLDADFLARTEETYGPDWEQDADRLHEILENEKEEAEIARDLRWVGQDTTPNSVSRHEVLISSGAVDQNGNLKPYKATGHKSVPMTIEELGDDGVQYPY